ncbi:Zinc-binding dehydrogenase [Phytophthora infestans]|uniref:Zinc-binding dehydrogenase n=1 Tax=Phytophthora infestans TaxID=4787 RepID=A0A8S9UNZ7_PHYIN|nr:Zinc-binding dehydrogenase [Phytophthora infestans]KAF4141247.1 Zinc-binding dehydrogenase [Phytophthora infestans]
MPVAQTFRAYQYDHYGPQEQELKLRLSVKQSELGSNQVRIKVTSAAINPIDYILLEQAGEAFTGKVPTPEKPFGIGFDAAGTVVEVGSEAKRLKVGDQVYAMTPFDACGTVADYAVFNEDLVALKPKNLTFDQAASIPLIGLTSYQALVEHAELQKGENVLILGGSSVVGMFAIQLAHAIGARVVTTTSAKNTDFVKGLGADRVINYHTHKWVQELDPHSVDVIYDCGMEADAWNSDAQLTLKQNTGRFVSLLPITEPVKSAQFGAKNLGNILVYPTAKGLEEIATYLEKGTIVPVIDTVYDFKKLHTALTKLKGRHSRGKLVIKVNPESQ